MNVITHTFAGLKCLTETKIQILCDHVSHTRLHTVEMGWCTIKIFKGGVVDGEGGSSEGYLKWGGGGGGSLRDLSKDI